MAHSRTAIKRARTSLLRRERNRKVRSTMKTMIRSAVVSIQGGQDGAEQELRQAISAIDRAACRGAIHRNKAARLKSKLARMHRSSLA